MKRNLVAMSIVICIGVIMLTAVEVEAGLNGTVSGKILTPDKTKLKDVVITLKSLDGSNPDRTVKSSKKGSYRFSNVTPGSYVIHAAMDGYVHKNSRVVRVSSNGKVRYSLYLEPRTEDDAPEVSELKTKEQRELNEKTNHLNQPATSTVPSSSGGGHSSVDSGSLHRN